VQDYAVRVFASHPPRHVSRRLLSHLDHPETTVLRPGVRPSSRRQLSLSSPTSRLQPGPSSCRSCSSTTAAPSRIAKPARRRRRRRAAIGRHARRRRRPSASEGRSARLQPYHRLPALVTTRSSASRPRRPLRLRVRRRVGPQPFARHAEDDTACRHGVWFPRGVREGLRVRW
jgi:hypothetical protein